MFDDLEGDQGKEGWTTSQKTVKRWTQLFNRRHVSQTTEWNGEILSATRAAGARGGDIVFVADALSKVKSTVVVVLWMCNDAESFSEKSSLPYFLFCTVLNPQRRPVCFMWQTWVNTRCCWRSAGHVVYVLLRIIIALSGQLGRICSHIRGVQLLDA